MSIIGKNYERLKEDITARLKDGTIDCHASKPFDLRLSACYFCLKRIEHPVYYIRCDEPFRNGIVTIDGECYTRIKESA